MPLLFAKGEIYPKAAMKRYRAVGELYKRGEFYGISEEIHVHALGNRVAVNAFNLDDRARTIGR